MLSEAEARRILLSAADHQFCEALKGVLKAYRPNGWLSISQTAALAGFSVRSLQRRLAREGSDFSRLAEQSRSELAIELLENTDITLTEIASVLGYTTPPNFSRAFKRWTGKSPSELRRKPGY